MTLPSQTINHTPYERQLAAERAERRNRFAKAAKPSPATIASQPREPASPSVPPPPPTPDEIKQWAERQNQRFGLKTPWFSIEAEIEAPERRRPTIALIQYATALHFGIAKTEMKSTRRTNDVVKPRQVAIYLAKILTPHSLPEIGRRFGGRDHTTVLHAIRRIKSDIEKDPRLAADVAALTTQIERDME